MKELIKATSDSKYVRYISIAIRGLDVGNVNSENRAKDFDRTFLHGSIIGFLRWISL